jgi:hypothetical protein
MSEGSWLMPSLVDAPVSFARLSESDGTEDVVEPVPPFVEVPGTM